MAGLLKARIGQVIVLSMVLAALAVCTAQAWEVQLAGIRLGQHAINLLDVYGEPDGVQTACGEDFAGGGAGAAGVGGGMEGMGEMGGEEGMMGGGEMAAGPPEAAGGPGAGEFPPGEGGMMGEGAGEGAVGAAGAGAGGGGESVNASAEPRWALPVWVALEGCEVEWFYRIGGVVLGFVMDRDGYIKTIVVAAENCGFARTALWRPHGYVKLGDDYKRVIYRYGWPHEMAYAVSATDITGSVGMTPWLLDPQGEVQGVPNAVTWGSVGRVPASDISMRYNRNNNISFTLHDMKVVRIHIWTNE